MLLPCRGKDDQGCASPFWQALCAARDVGAGVITNTFLMRYFTAIRGEKAVLKHYLPWVIGLLKTLRAYVKVLGGIAENATRFV